MQLHQINMGFEPLQDRLLLRVSTTDRLEYRLWLTRRIVKAWWPNLIKLAGESEVVRRQTEPGSRQAVLGFQHEHALQKAKFSDAYEPAQAVSDEPMLVWAIRMRPLSSGAHELVLTPREGKGVTMTLTETMLHALLKLLQTSIKLTDWDLQLEVPGAIASPTAAEGAARKPN